MPAAATLLDEWLLRDAVFIPADLRLGVGVESCVPVRCMLVLVVVMSGLVWIYVSGSVPGCRSEWKASEDMLEADTGRHGPGQG
jgi:hypothetical protein